MKLKQVLSAGLLAAGIAAVGAPPVVAQSPQKMRFQASFPSS